MSFTCPTCGYADPPSPDAVPDFEPFTVYMTLAFSLYGDDIELVDDELRHARKNWRDRASMQCPKCTHATMPSSQS